MAPFFRPTYALVLLSLSATLAACGFPDYGGFESTSSASGTGGAPSSSSATGGAGGIGGAGGTGGVQTGCTADADCTGSQMGPVCDLSTNTCVACLPMNDPCPLGTYCSTEKMCVTGCNEDADCNVGGGGGGGAGGGGGGVLICDLPSHVCMGCATDDQCPLGTICELQSTLCVPGCTPKHDCQPGLACCDGSCFDLSTEELHCGVCNMPCEPPGGVGECVGGMCGLASCLSGLNDCDLDPNNGCESDPLTDPVNCGGCMMPCAPLPNSTPACSGGSCVLGPCTGTFADCDANPANGCEADLETSVGNCSACNNACVLPNSNEVCQAGTCIIGSCDGGFADCDSTNANGCEINTQTDPQNCGGCSNTCSLPNASPQCVMGACQVAVCAPPYADCNLMVADGCETNLNTDVLNCGGCATQCTLPNATPSCSNGACVIASCNAGFDDCDGIAANGCETNLNTNVQHCGTCGLACSTNNGTPSCSGGQCSIMCDVGFADCDGNVANGCEISTVTNVNNCGSCNNVCPPQGGTPACVNSQCTVSSCQPGKGDCDGIPGNGCETDTTTDVLHCGGCGLACFVVNGTPGCGGSACFIASCNPGYADCDGVYSNGCETSLKTLGNCGACGVVCSLPNANTSCATGTCEISSCVGTFADCDGNKPNGCEIDTATNTSNCGACMNQCSTNNGTPTCTAGACGIICAAGYGNCDANLGNGCETATTNNVNACGGCGIVCAVQNGTPACNGTTCMIQSCTPPFKDCDGQYGNGCEINSSNNINNCGTCGTMCTNANGTTSCTTGLCTPMCSPGFASCDGNANNGCETNTNTSTLNCGFCGNVCSFPNGTAVCQTAMCVLSQCNAGFGDCDLIQSNGCETPLNTVSNCGSCGTACTNGHGTTSCSGGACSPSCSMGYLSCDGNPNNGCETSITTLANCGGCGVTCDFANASESCSTGTCTFVSCNLGYGDCDGNQANGCETNTDTSNQHCGACNSPCAMGKICVSGTCVNACPAGTADCDGLPGNGCEVNTTSDGNNCSSCGMSCTSSQYCSNSTCTACPAGMRDCNKDGADACEINTNTDATNCGACGTKCGSDGTCGCAAGMCSGGTISFSEDFSDNNRGWTLDTEWEIGSATLSSGHEQGYPDPANDHTPSADNGVAGIVIGGNYTPTPLHGYYYLTSPVIDLSGVSGTVLLSYWRWLNCDWDPYTTETVEVFNGTSWVVLWSSASVGNNLITDNAWTRFENDVTTYKNASFQIRFGYKNGKQGAFIAWIMSGWNIDDVSLSSTTCN